MCKKRAGVWDYDHIDGNRSNNQARNSQALCSNCHAKKIRFTETMKDIRC
jgi:hypothetical protein